MVSIRFATPDDASLIYKLIQQKAEFDRSVGAYSGTLQTSEAKINATIFGDYPFAYVLFAEENDNVIGFALYGFRYSSFAGQPSIWLDDLYVMQYRRSNGAGSLLMDQLKQLALKNSCTHLSWNADARNIRALEFYRRLGAMVIEQKENRCFLKWTP